jgi:hypothetical protein
MEGLRDGCLRKDDGRQAAVEGADDSGPARPLRRYCPGTQSRPLDWAGP